MVQHYLTLFDTEDGYLLQTDEDGNPIMTPCEDETLNHWDIFPQIKSKEMMNKVVTVLDPCGILQNKWLNDMMTDLINADTVTNMTFKLGNDVVHIFGIKMKAAIRRYITAPHYKTIHAKE